MGNRKLISKNKFWQEKEKKFSIIYTIVFLLNIDTKGKVVRVLN
jgi:hypothetical protein